MIDNLNHLTGKQILNELSGNEGVQGNVQQNKEVMIALSKIQVGDILSGKLMLDEHETMLKLENGLKLLAHLPHQIVSDQFLDFLVVGKGRQHLELEQVQVNQLAHKQEDIEDTLMKEMNLPETLEMKQVVSQWMDKQLPLIKNQMLQVYQLAKNYPIPSEALINIKAQALTLSEQEVKLMTQYKSEGIEWIGQFIEDALSQVSQDKAVAFCKTLVQHFPNDKVLESYFLKNDGDLSLLNAKSENKGYRALILSHQPIEKGETVEPFIGKNVSFEKESFIKELISSEEVLEELLKGLPKEKLKDLAHHLIRKSLVIEHKNTSKETKEELSKVSEEANRLRTILKDAKNQLGEITIKESGRSLEQVASVLEKYHAEGQYYCFPLQIGQQQTSGELYFFKPKKNKKDGQTKQSMYIVLALEMPNLKHIEVHLIEDKEQLVLKLKVANQSILKQIEANEHKLRALMDETLMPIGDIKVECLEQPISKKISKQKEALGRLDFRI